MAKTYADLTKQIEQLSREAERLKSKEVAGVIARIKEAIASYGLTAEDLGLSVGTPKRAAQSAKVNKVTAGAKYKNGDGQVWGGRGPRPKWLREAIASGRSLSDFAA